MELKTRLFRSSEAYLTTPSALAVEKNRATCETGNIQTINVKTFKSKIKV